MKEQLFCSQDL